MPNWYVSREQTLRALASRGLGRTANDRVDRIIEAASRYVDDLTKTWFIPKTQTRLYRWPLLINADYYRLWLDAHLLSVTTLLTKAQDASPTTIAAADYFLEDANLGPPYTRIEIDLSSASAFSAGATPQRSISVAGSWGYGNTTASAGTVASGLASDAAATTCVCSDATLIDVGDTLLIDTEQLFVRDRTNATLGTILLNGALTADKSETSVIVDGSHGIIAGETILVGSEKMLVEAVSTNTLTVVRAFDGTTLAAHANDTAVHVYRTLTLTRGVNGTTAAVHANATAISKYTIPAPVRQLALALAVSWYEQEGAGWGREVGTGEGAREFKGSALAALQAEVVQYYKRYLKAAV